MSLAEYPELSIFFDGFCSDITYISYQHLRSVVNECAQSADILNKSPRAYRGPDFIINGSQACDVDEQNR
jgi:hypothetical protein